MIAYRLTFLENKVNLFNLFQVGNVDVQVLDERLKELDARKSSSLDSH